MAGKVVLHFLQTNRSYHKELEIGHSIVAGKIKGCNLNLSTHFNGPIERISRRHFKISKTNQGVFLTDLKSTNGTYLNREFCLAQEIYPLRHGDTIEVAKNSHFKIDVSIEQDPNATAVVPEEESSSYHIQLILGLPLYLDEQTSIFFTSRTDLPTWKLTRLENDLLKYLYEQKGRTCLYYDIASNVWNYPDMPYDAIRQTVKKIRKKLNQISPGAGKRYLRAINGFGYKLVTE